MMKNKVILSVLALSLGLVLALLMLFGGARSARATSAAELQVCPSGCAYTSIQDAVDDANPGDIIKVAQGIYDDMHTLPGLNTATFTATQVVAITKPLTLRGGYNNNFTAWNPDIYPTILDAQGQGRGIYITGYIAPTIEGLRITRGDSAGLGGGPYGDDTGGGIYIVYSSAIISGNLVYDNAAYRGGGIWFQDCTVILRNNTIRDNIARWAGAGIASYRSPVTIQENIILSNTAVYAGGLFLHQSDATLRGNSIISNTATDSEGGGVSLLSSQATLDSNLIRANRVYEAGGGVYLNTSNALLTNNVIADNYADRLGSAMCIIGSSPKLIHTTIARNNGWGGGVYVTTSNFGDIYSHVTMTNTIVFSHTEGVIVEKDNTATLQSTLWYANLIHWIGLGTVTRVDDVMRDPAFAPDGYHLDSASAAVDSGVAAGVVVDIEGDQRPQGAGFDLGADESFWRRIFLPLTARGTP